MELWNLAYPATIAYDNLKLFESYLDTLEKSVHFLYKDGNRIYGWLSVFNRSELRWFLLIIHPELQRKGVGKLLLEKAKQEEQVLNGWVVDRNDYKKRDGSVYYSPLAFYQKNGFMIVEGDRYQEGRISAVRIKWKKTD